MIKQLLHLSFPCLLSFLAACSPAGTSSGEIAVIDVDMQHQAPLDEFIRGNGRCVRLATSGDCLIGAIDKIIVSHDNLYIADRQNRTVYIFSADDGRFLGKVSRAGRGPGEYAEMSDADVYQGYIYVLSHPDQALYIYSADGSDVRTVPLPHRYAKLKVADGGHVWLYAENSNNDHYNYAFFNIEDGNIEARFDPFAEDIGYMRPVSPFCGEDGQTLFISEFLDDRIYSLSAEDGYAPAYQLRTNLQYTVPHTELDTKTPIELADTYRYKEALQNIPHVVRNGDRLLIAARCFFTDYAIRNCLIKTDLGTGETLYYRIGDAIDERWPLFNRGSIIGYTQHEIISMMDAFYVTDQIQRGQIDDPELLQVKETDNPILIFHRLAI